MSSKSPRAASQPDAGEILARLRSGKRVRRPLGTGGRVAIDRPLPFLCVYRGPAEGEDPGTRELVTGVASYLVARDEPKGRSRTAALVRGLCRGLADDFGGVLLLEVWAQPEPAEEPSAAHSLRIVAYEDHSVPEAAEQLEASLSRVRLPASLHLAVETVQRRKIGPPGLPPLLAAGAAAEGCHVLGIELPRVYVDPEKGVVFPVVHRALRRGLTAAIHRAVYRFTRLQTSHRPPHYHALGAQSLTKAVWDVDDQLAAVSGQFDFLLLTTPRNADEAWAAFRRSRFEKTPRFSYRPRPFDVSIAKRELYAAPIERIEDPTVSDLFHEQQHEIDRKLTMIAERGTPRFVHESVQLFGLVEEPLLRAAVDVLERIPSRAREATRREKVDAHHFAARAEEEIKHLRRQHEAVTSRVEIRQDVAGLMVSRGNLLIGARTVMPAARVEAAIQHEVGTHVLTYFNGMAQPFHQLRVGLAGYEELQEGLAVFSEYLVGGLSRPRLRLLAARVVAVAQMLEGASFVEVFRELDRNWDLERRMAFTTTMRVFRGGGHTKDALYLRGLLRLLEHLRGGAELGPLYVGKIGLQHVPFVEELSFRKVLVPPPLRPRFLKRAEVQQRLARVRAGIEVHELSKSTTPSKKRSSA